MAFDTTNEVDIDAIFNTQIDMEEQAAIAEAQLLPTGSYTMEGPLTVTVTQSAVKLLVDAAGKPLEFNRPIVRFFGQGTSEEHKGGLGFAISPVSIYQIKDGQDVVSRHLTPVEGSTPDLTTKLNSAAIKMYQKESGTAPEVYGELVEYIKQGVKARAIKTEARGEYEAGNLVVGISSL